MPPCALEAQEPPGSAQGLRARGSHVGASLIMRAAQASARSYCISGEGD